MMSKPPNFTGLNITHWPTIAFGEVESASDCATTLLRANTPAALNPPPISGFLFGTEWNCPGNSDIPGISTRIPLRKRIPIGGKYPLIFRSVADSTEWHIMKTTAAVSTIPTESSWKPDFVFRKSKSQFDGSKGPRRGGLLFELLDFSYYWSYACLGTSVAIIS